jgi:hypothetical protein
MHISWPSQTAEGAGNTGCWPHPLVLRAKDCALCARKQHRAAEQPAFPAQWVTAYTCSPRCAGLVSHRRLTHRSQGLIPASGNRDRTISPSALRASSLRAPRPSHPAPRQVTIGRNAPLAGRDGRNIRLICTSEKANYFPKHPLNGRTHWANRRNQLSAQAIFGCKWLADGDDRRPVGQISHVFVRRVGTLSAS